MILPVQRFATVVLETKTPLSIAAGSEDRLFDTVLARDASGLPAIPATSLKGVLRNLYLRDKGKDEADKLFGFASPGSAEGQAARLDVSWGVAHGSDDLPASITAPQAEEDVVDDPLLNDLRLLAADHPVLRRRTKINSQGAASARERGQFDRSVIPVGTRFSVQVAMGGAQIDDARDWREILALFLHPLLRLGGATRSGLGRLAVACDEHGPRIWESVYDLRKSDDVAVFALDRRRLFELRPASRAVRVRDLQAPRAEFADVRTIILDAESFWRIGGGVTGVLEADIDAKARVLTEPVVDWSAKPARVSWQKKRVVAPGAGIKGALRHRTAFHFARLKGEFADLSSASPSNFVDRSPAVTALFGEARAGFGEGVGRRGRVIIDDLTLSTPARADGSAARLLHNSIDRFTGGVRDRLLFDEEALFCGSLSISIAVEKALSPTADDERYLRAFHLAVDDLARGWLPLGAGSRSGHGVFTERRP